MSDSEEPDADPDADADSGADVDADPDADADSGADVDADSDVVSDEDPDADSPNSETDPEPSSGSKPSDRSEVSAEDDSSGFLGNIKNARGQLGDAKEAFSNARGAGNLPTDEEGRVRLICRRYEERRLAPLDDKGRPTCYEAGNEDCESCVDAVSDGEVGTW